MSCAPYRTPAYRFSALQLQDDACVVINPQNASTGNGGIYPSDSDEVSASFKRQSYSWSVHVFVCRIRYKNNTCVYVKKTSLIMYCQFYIKILNLLFFRTSLNKQGPTGTITKLMNHKTVHKSHAWQTCQLSVVVSSGKSRYNVCHRCYPCIHFLFSFKILLGLQSLLVFTV